LEKRCSSHSASCNECNTVTVPYEVIISRAVCVYDCCYDGCIQTQLAVTQCVKVYQFLFSALMLLLGDMKCSLVYLYGSAFVSINNVSLCWAQLLLGWVTVTGQIDHFGM